MVGSFVLPFFMGNRFGLREPPLTYPPFLNCAAVLSVPDFGVCRDDLMNSL
jgi:hypothetical protein